MAKYCYRLQSCNPKEYEDINNLCLETYVPDGNKTVYINGDSSKVFRLIFVGVDVCICEKLLPPYTVTTKECGLRAEPRCFRAFPCDGSKEALVFCTTEPVGTGLIVKIEGECWQISGEEAYEGQPVTTIDAIYSDCETCEGAKPAFWLLRNCSNPRDFRRYQINQAVNQGDIVTFREVKGCFEVLQPEEEATQPVTLISIYRNCEECQSTQPKYWRLQSCDATEFNTVRLNWLTVNPNIQAGDVIKVQESDKCWVVIGDVEEAETVWTLTSVIKEGCADEECKPEPQDCSMDGERTIAYATMVRLPEPPIPDKGFKECCYTNLVLAHQTDSDPYKNDFTGFYFQKQTSGDDCDFILHELATGNTYALNNGTYGVFKDFGSITGNGDLTTYIVQWRKVLAVLGTGLYQVERAITVAGLTFSMMSNTFTLEQFTNVTADKTIRLDASMDGTMVHLGVDFKNSDFETSIRTFGFFGRRNPKYKQDNLVKRNYDTVQISMSQENEYEMQTGLIPECITTEIYDFILFGNELFASDYNLINHSYKFRLHEVELDKNKGGKYYTTNRDSRINITFKDRVKNKRKINC